MRLFRCPDCGREHDEPAHATFVLTVQCLDCAFDVEGAVEVQGTLVGEGVPLLEATLVTASAGRRTAGHAA